MRTCLRKDRHLQTPPFPSIPCSFLFIRWLPVLGFTPLPSLLFIQQFYLFLSFALKNTCIGAKILKSIWFCLLANESCLAIIIANLLLMHTMQSPWVMSHSNTSTVWLLTITISFISINDIKNTLASRRHRFIWINSNSESSSDNSSFSLSRLHEEQW